MKYGCIGEHLPHSFSKDIHEKIGDYAYDLCEIRREDLDAFMTERDFSAINVTIPYKEAVIPHLFSMNDTAREVGAVNTVVKDAEGRLHGYNTDVGGLVALIKRVGADVAKKKVLILGTGGTSKAAMAAASALHASEIYRVSRTKNEGALSYEEAYALHSDADIIINTTPCGMFPKADGTPVELDRFKKLSALIDAIYNPLSTRLVLEARKRGIKAEGGLYMLVAQAVLAAEIFTGQSYPAHITDEIYSNLLLQKQNIVLIGMPSSGKSTVGKALAELTGQTFVDTDALIEARTGREIKEILRKEGEAFFRDLETEVIKDLSLKGGLIISTGGGAVLRKENVDLLKLNGRLFLIDTPLESLIPTEERPLSDSLEKLSALFKERRPIYLSAADDIILPDGISPDKTAIKIREKMKSK